jgi:hypothetical protein
VLAAAPRSRPHPPARQQRPEVVIFTADGTVRLGMFALMALAMDAAVTFLQARLRWN